MTEENPSAHDDEPAVLRSMRRLFDQGLSTVHFLGLAFIAVTAVACFIAECWRIGSIFQVTLGDLLLLFLYIEVLVMARGAMQERHAVTIEMPICIAVVAMARYMVMSEEHDPAKQLLYAGAVAVLVGVLILWRMRKGWAKRLER